MSYKSQYDIPKSLALGVIFLRAKFSSLFFFIPKKAGSVSQILQYVLFDQIVFIYQRIEFIEIFKLLMCI
jgi:hypothetical protein